MTNRPHKDGFAWPAYLPGWNDHIYAIGMISLNYGQLEGMFALLFSEATGMSRIQVNAFFQRLPNDARLKVFEQLSSSRQDFSNELKELLSWFKKGYDTCAENRNSIMHSSHGGRFSREVDYSAGLLLTKFSKTGTEVCCPCSLDDLRRIADEIYSYTRFCLLLSSEVPSVAWLFAQRHRHEPRPLLDRPAPAVVLDWKPLSEYQAQGAIKYKTVP